MTKQFKESDIYLKLKDLQSVKNQIKKLTEAETQIQFHLDRYSSIKERFKQKKETVLNQEELIKNLTESITRHL